MKHTCEKRIYRSPAWIGPAPLHGVTAKYEHLGKWYCKTHHPPTVKAKEAEKSRKWKANWGRDKRAKAAAIHEAEQRVLKAASDFALFADIARGRHAAKLYATLSELKALGWEPES